MHLVEEKYILEVVRENIRLMALNNVGFETGVSNDDLWYEVCIICQAALDSSFVPDELSSTIQAYIKCASKLYVEGGELV